MKTLWFVALLVVILGGAVAVPVGGGTKPAATVDIAVRSASGFTQIVGSVFLIDIRLEGPELVGGADAWLTFDPNYVVVVDAAGSPTTNASAGLINGPMPRNYASIDNAAGVVKYAAGYPDPGQSSTAPLTLVQVRLKALAATGGTPLNLMANKTLVIDAAGNNVTGTHINAILVIQAPVAMTNTPTPTMTATATRTRTPTPTRTVTATPTATRTATRTPTLTSVPGASWTPTRTATPTLTPVSAYSPTPTPTPTITLTPFPTASHTPTATLTPTEIATPTGTPTFTATQTQTPTSTPTATSSPTSTATRAPTIAPTSTLTRTPMGAHILYLPIIVKR